MEYIEEIQEQVILVGVQLDENDNVKESLDELEELADTAGAQTVGKIIQNRETVHPGTYIGKGKIEEVRALMLATDATGIICDDELSPAQMNNLEHELECKVMDRTLLILDIFAKHATTSEGKIQVELAQLRYRASRLVGLGASLSRLGGGIGTRGPGEKKLESDRRLIRKRITALKEELSQVEKHRELLRTGRTRGKMKTVAIVGYTNAGKSTLLNTLTGAGVLSEDKLFATLDPTTRSYIMEDGQQILLTDTVGFIRKLPHHLIEAFKSTLEEARYSDIILHVADCSNPQMDMQMHVVKETLKDLGIVDKTMITVFNKVDRMEDPDRAGEEHLIQLPRDFGADYQVRISAKTGEGIGALERILQTIIQNRRVYLKKIFPYTQSGRIQTIRRYGQLLKEEYREDGVAVEAYVPAELFASLYKD